MSLRSPSSESGSCRSSPPVGVVSGLEAAEELVHGVQHLLREALGNLVLVLATAFEQGGEPLVARQRQKALLGE